MAGTNVLVVQNGPTGGPGRFGECLTEDGLTLDVVHGYAEQEPPQALDHQAMVVLGGGFMPDETNRAPWLDGTRKLVQEALETGIPYFGICLGGQLLAQVAGGAVRAEHGQPELGSTPMTLRPEAADDPLFHGLPAAVTAIENHVDAITGLPPDARWLMTSTGCPYQAFRVGETAWGVQFHPEITPERIQNWDPERIHRLGFDRDEVNRTAQRNEPAADPVWRTVAHRFAGVVHARAASGLPDGSRA